ncbi:hypothetical protein AFLA_013956 [Aspergillus flavus NRRL3357]|nr:hypothetical protein AFLA_013956 [Aspergillus flavus NRRL3357]
MPPKEKSTPDSAPSHEITGQSALPISRIKKIIQLDEDIVQCSSNATFVIAMATEMFIQYLTEQGHNVVKSERKPRKLIQYKRSSYGAIREAEIEKGQRTLNGTVPHANGESEHQEELQAIEEKPSKSPRTPVVMHATGAVSTLVVDRTVDNQSRGDDGDVEMVDQ